MQVGGGRGMVGFFFLSPFGAPRAVTACVQDRAGQGQTRRSARDHNQDEDDHRQAGPGNPTGPHARTCASLFQPA